MKNEKYLNEISEIKNMMNQSSRFISLSGLSGVLAGIYSLIGGWFAYNSIYFENTSIANYKTISIPQSTINYLFINAITVIMLSIVSSILLSIKKAKKSGEQIWNISSKRLIINFCIPLATGGVFILFLIEKEIYSLVAPLMLIFYGLGCVNESKYTLGDIRYLGITIIVIGLFSTWFLEYGLLFWTLGFGICHILYGSMMYFKYDRN